MPAAKPSAKSSATPLAKSVAKGVPRAAALRKAGATASSTVSVAPARRVRPVPAVSRAVAILRLLGSSPEPLGVKAIAQSLGLVTSTCLHILRVLVDEELLRVDATKRYSLGAGILPIARSVLEGGGFAAAAQPGLDRLARTWGTTAIGVEAGGLDHMVVMALSHSHVPFRLHVDVGSRFPALISATGRLVAAYTTQPWPEVERRFRALRWQNAPTLEAWRKDVERVRRRGYALDRGNYLHGVAVISVPILDPRSELTHALVVIGVSEQIDNARCTAIAADMQAEAARLSTLLLSRA
jgi:DNA-binding IclR family transcriptional regulator